MKYPSPMPRTLLRGVALADRPVALPMSKLTHGSRESTAMASAVTLLAKGNSEAEDTFLMTKF